MEKNFVALAVGVLLVLLLAIGFVAVTKTSQTSELKQQIKMEKSHTSFYRFKSEQYFKALMVLGNTYKEDSVKATYFVNGMNQIASVAYSIGMPVDGDTLANMALEYVGKK